VSRALTAEEQTRYPWASRINDYVPVGRLRKIGLGVAVVSVACFLAGSMALVLIAVDIHDGVRYLSGTLGRLTLIASGLLAVVAFVLGAVGAFPAAARNARGALLWSVAAMSPALVAAIVLLLVSR
jgi:hypothetical protein